MSTSYSLTSSKDCIPANRKMYGLWNPPADHRAKAYFCLTNSTKSHNGKTTQPNLISSRGISAIPCLSEAKNLILGYMHLLLAILLWQYISIEVDLLGLLTADMIKTTSKTQKYISQMWLFKSWLRAMTKQLEENGISSDWSIICCLNMVNRAQISVFTKFSKS